MSSKDVRRRAKLADKQRRQKARLKARPPEPEFPAVAFQAYDADPAFVDLVRDAVRAVDLRDTTVFQPREQEVYRRVKAVGSRVALAEFEASIAGRDDRHLIRAFFHNNFGHAVFTRIPAETLLRYVPFNDVMFVPYRDVIRAYFRALRRAKGPAGTVYYSRNEPAVEVGGRRLTVAFSGHALQRAGPRLAYRWPSYASTGDVFAFFDQCLHYEVCELHGGHLAFTFWENCAPGFTNYGLAEGVLGAKFVRGGNYHYRVGYCPAVVEGRFLKAKTLLFPGYASTPEYTAVVSAGLPAVRRRAVLAEAKELTMKRVTDTGPALVKWFHDHGVEQVRRGKVPYANPWVYPG